MFLCGTERDQLGLPIAALKGTVHPSLLVLFQYDIYSMDLFYGYIHCICSLPVRSYLENFVHLLEL